jgi:hypothetical protein
MTGKNPAPEPPGFIIFTNAPLSTREDSSRKNNRANFDSDRAMVSAFDCPQG